MEKKSVWIAVLCGVLACIIGFSLTASGRAAWNLWLGRVQKVDDATNYQTRKDVEDSCRSMIASYEADLQTYEAYREGTEEQQDWAVQAKVRANRTASIYNNYILKNSYVWKGNIPDDIRTELEYVD